jgi:hypothetical protein
MQTKKALRQLSKAEALISAVGSRYTPGTPHLRDMLRSASSMLGQAKATLDGGSGPAPQKAAQPAPVPPAKNRTEVAATPEFTGNKTEFIRLLVAAREPLGVVPKEVAEVFTARHIDRSENLIYNALSTLVKQKKLKKKGDRYFSAASTGSKAKTGSEAKAGPKAKSVAPKKKRISPEGLKRIVEANKKRWARERAARTGQKSARAAGKTVPAKKATGKTAI